MLPTVQTKANATTTSATSDSKKIKTKNKKIIIPLLNDDNDQELHESKVATEKRYNMRKRLIKQITNECDDDSQEEDDED